MMYLLLRDNKQSGPYSLDDLKIKGLKAYDLVWVEGRSAAWRYPSEIDELRAFAPVVEEQPFDRFYKKPAVAAAPSAAAEEKATTVGTVTAETHTMTSEAVAVTQPATSTHPAIRRTIYVTMPGGLAARATAAAKEATPAKEAAPNREVMREPAYTPSPIREHEPTPIRETAPKRQPKKMWLPIGVGTAVLVLLAVGIFIGLSIQKNTPTQKLVSRTVPDNAQPIVRTASQQLPSQPVINPAAGKGQVNPSNGQGAVPNAQPAASTTPPITTAATTSPIIRQPHPTTPNKQKTDAPKTQAVPPVTITDSTAIQSAVAHREAVHRTDVVTSQPIDDRESLRVALANQVSVSTNKYDIGTFGGIRNLQVTVTNRSAHSLDLVVVAVSYIQANKKTYKTENLYFRGIAPGSALMLEAPKTSRGISVEYKITSINSKELGLSEPGNG